MVKGLQSIAFRESPYLVSSASVVGKKEGEGPLGKMFDMVEQENLFGENTWEEAESTGICHAFWRWGRPMLRRQASGICSAETSCVRELQPLWA